MFRPNMRLLTRISAANAPARVEMMRRCLQRAALQSRRHTLRAAAALSVSTAAMHTGSSVFPCATPHTLPSAPSHSTMGSTHRLTTPVRAMGQAGLLRRAGVAPMAAASVHAVAATVLSARGYTSLFACTRAALANKDGSAADGSAKSKSQLQAVNNLERYRGEEEEERDERGEQEQDPFGNNNREGYLPFPPPFHTVNVIMLIILCNLLCYVLMNYGSTDIQDFLVENFTLSHENAHKIYPLFTNALYQENLLQLVIDTWLLWQFGDTMLNFLGNKRMTFFAIMCTLCGSFIHLGRQYFELHYGMDELEVRGRCYGSNPLIMGFISVEGLIFRHLNFIQQPPIPFLVLTAFVMVIDVWRIFTTKPEEHGAATGGALVAYILWALPTRLMGLDRLTATF